MPKKRGATIGKKNGTKLHAGHAVLPRPALPPRGTTEEKELAQAILESRDVAAANERYQTSFAEALTLSREEAEEAEAMRLAIDASLADVELDSTAEALVADVGQHVHAEATPADFPVVAPVAPPVVDEFSCYLIKVSYKHDMRRLRTQWPAGTPAADMLMRIQTTIEEGFGFTIGSLLASGNVLKYCDDEGDVCTLVEDTFMDFMDMALNGSTLKIILDWTHQSSEPVMEKYSVATPPTSPRSIEDDYDCQWSIVEA